GEFGKAVQAMGLAVSEDPSNPYRYANLGVAYYRNQQAAEALEAFEFAIRGGVTEDGVVVNGFQLNSPEVVPYYYTFGLLLARANRCAEALPISQALIASFPDDEIAVGNADEMVLICEGLEGLSTATPQPAATEAETMGEETPDS
ncbi:MAG TPA: hypothetical protein VI688_04450, partial [Anaerolineales bacterium]|nr:hypothetical protein [Anaerolineales bacterium]